MPMKDERLQELKTIPVLDNGQVYIYIMLNEAGKLKVGQTTNIYQRYLALCGSNSQGIDIVRIFCSEPTYLFSLEQVMHNKFNKYRIKNTEWFYGEDLTFEHMVEVLDSLFSSAEYVKCNELRKSMTVKRKNKDDKN